MLLEFDRRLNRLVDLNITPGFDDDFTKHLQDGDPILIFNHQAHADGILASVVVEHLLSLARGSRRELEIKGFVIPIARSLVDGQQSRVLQLFYYPFSFLMSRKGLETLPYTRPKDEALYGMDRRYVTEELKSVVRRLQEGYMLAVFPEGSVQGGRHPENGDPEDIEGMQEIRGNELIQAYRMTKAASRGQRRAFYVAIGLHGGFRLQSPNKEMLGPTWGGLATFLGVPELFAPHVKTDANLGIIIPEESIAARFGQDWVKAGQNDELVRAINRFIMEPVASLVPDKAKGAYA